jgi:hypothetical protein
MSLFRTVQDGAPALVGDALPRVVWLTAALVVVALAMGAFMRGLKAPLARPTAWLGMPVAFAAAWMCVAAAVAGDEGFPRRALALAVLAAGLGHAPWFRFAALPEQVAPLRHWLCRAGAWAGVAGAIALWMTEPPLFVRLAAAITSAAALSVWFTVGRPRRAQPVADGGRPRARFPCPRCGTVGDWDEGVQACGDCGLFVHLWFDPEAADEPARFAPEDPDPARSVRFACAGCGNVVDWVQGHTACGVCQRTVLLHWNAHVVGE